MELMQELQPLPEAPSTSQHKPESGLNVVAGASGPAFDLASTVTDEGQDDVKSAQTAVCAAISDISLKTMMLIINIC